MPPLSQEQIEFRAYLRRHLPMTLAEVVRESFDYGRHFEEDDGIVLQPRDLLPKNPAIRRMEATEQSLFAVGLYWMVSIDEAMYTYHRQSYDRFRGVTRFPKLVGDCPGGCGTHLHPTAALQLVGGDAGNWMHNRLIRFSMLAWYAPAVEDILARMAAQHGLPMLPELLRRDFEEMGIPERQRGWGIVGDDPLRPYEEISWRMPVLSREQIHESRERAAAMRRAAHPRRPATRPNRTPELREETDT